ncbi:molybdopterin molybdotransferase MoeA [Candidatus Cetobacterium colombiensis]|uniref:Molybdopterin molybdenumtransferase n=1 Tax=Candidatus Cetobacterium colombiensis TaxID=3073100 RepID=A0ABU4WA68_9FUSO|nr:molybdopterin molybdotransferase MoeA [Candidatus Cetobacterium colombiensis]MDX8336035.1 molybdopterin molybdotransferase MoeA [Candidatus Cetobacterium colombiensis]
MEQINLENAIEILLENVKPLKEIEEKYILDSLGFVLAEDIISPLNNPPFNRSPLDGFTFNNLDTLGATKENPITFKVISEVFAGDFSKETLNPKEAFRIMTGAPIPNGCNCVIKQEEVSFDENTKVLEIYRELKPFENFCFLGEDLKVGEIVVKKGEVITYNHIGVFASLGINLVKVFKKPKVGILSLGSELTMPGEPLKEGKIFNSNLFTLISKLKYLGVEGIMYPPMSDDPLTVTNFISKELKNLDILITTGGVSVGKKDIMHDVIRELEAKRLFWKINIQPGTPVLASVKDEKLILSLSGNPFASLVNFELLGRPVLSKMSLNSIKETSTIDGIVRGEFSKSSSKRRFIRGYFKNGEIFLNNNKHSSGTISSLIGKNAIVEIAPGTPQLKDGDKVKVILID